MTGMMQQLPMVGDQEQFATLMALMVRSIGLPARVAVGFVPPPTDGRRRGRPGFGGTARPGHLGLGGGAVRRLRLGRLRPVTADRTSRPETEQQQSRPNGGPSPWRCRRRCRRRSRIRSTPRTPISDPRTPNPDQPPPADFLVLTDGAGDSRLAGVAGRGAGAAGAGDPGDQGRPSAPARKRAERTRCPDHRWLGRAAGLRRSTPATDLRRG